MTTADDTRNTALKESLDDTYALVKRHADYRTKDQPEKQTENRAASDVEDDIKDINFCAGQTVTVEKYGTGEVVSTKGDTVEIMFLDGATRTFMRGYVIVA